MRLFWKPVAACLAIFLAGAVPSIGQETVTLKVAYWGPKTSVYFAGADKVLDRITEMSNGQVQFERYYSEALVAAREIPDALETGIADVGTVLAAFYPSKFPLANVGGLPGIDSHLWPAMLAYYETFRDIPEFKAQLEARGIRMLAPMGYGPYYVWSTNEIATLDGLSGQKLRSIGVQAKLLSALGAAPVAMTPPEIYDALQKGTLNGSVGDWVIADDYDFHDVAKFFNQVPMGVGTAFLGISLSAWEKIPADVREKIDAEMAEFVTIFAQYYEVEGFAKSRKVAEAAGVKVVSIPKADAAAVRAKAQEITWEPWVREMEAANMPGRKVLENYLKQIEANAALDPLKYE